jgi:predicted transcriptional regulator
MKEVCMIEGFTGNPTVEKILLFLHVFEEGFQREMARNFGLSLAVVQKQLDRLERGGIIVSRSRGRTRTYSINPACPYRKELKALLGRILEFQPDNVILQYYTRRTRPRLKGK